MGMRLMRGAASGLMATIAMTGVMYAGKAFGLLHAPPPKQITRNAERKAGAPPSTQPPGTFSVSWVAASSHPPSQR